MARHGGLKLLALGVEEVDVASSVANRKDVAIWRVGQAIDRVVNLQGAHNFLPRLCADEVYATIRTTRRDDVTGGPALHAVNCRVKARRAPAARPVVVPQDQIRHVRLAVEQGVETRA